MEILVNCAIAFAVGFSMAVVIHGVFGDFTNRVLPRVYKVKQPEDEDNE